MLGQDDLVGYFGQLKTEATRYSVITFWHQRIVQLEDKNSLLALLKFFVSADHLSAAAGDGGYVSRDAEAAEDEITLRLQQIYPFFEGVFAIDLKCASTDTNTSPTYCTKKYIDRLVMMDTTSTDDLQVSLVSSQGGQSLGTYQHPVVSNGATQIDVVDSPNGTLSSLHLELNSDTHTISGWFKSTDSGQVVQITGVQIGSALPVYDAQKGGAAPIPQSVFAAPLKGVYGGEKASITVSDFPSAVAG